MVTTILLMEKLLEIERSVGHTDPLVLRSMVMEAETQVLQVERDLIKVLSEVRRLREQRESMNAAAEETGPMMEQSERPAPAFLGPPIFAI